MISKEVLMESLRQRETELHALQDEVERLRKENKMLRKYVDTEHMYNDGLLTIEGEMIE